MRWKKVKKLTFAFVIRISISSRRTSSIAAILVHIPPRLTGITSQSICTNCTILSASYIMLIKLSFLEGNYLGKLLRLLGSFLKDKTGSSHHRMLRDSSRYNLYRLLFYYMWHIAHHNLINSLKTLRNQNFTIATAKWEKFSIRTIIAPFVPETIAGLTVRASVCCHPQKFSLDTFFTSWSTHYIENFR